MTGKILGFDLQNQDGVISGENGKRYKFTQSVWKDTTSPKKDLKIDFAVDENDMAIDIYVIKDTAAENTSTMMGIISLAVTFFLGFIGTFLSRVIISKQPVGGAVVPTLIHFIITVTIIIPVIGWIVYLIGTLYYMVKNYKLATIPNHIN